MEYVYDPELFSRWDHVECRVGDDDKFYVDLYLTDEVIEYGPYAYYGDARDLYNKIIDDNVNTKFPFLKEKPNVETMDDTAAIKLVSQVIMGVKMNYISEAKTLKKKGIPIPTSKEEYWDLVNSFKIRDRVFPGGNIYETICAAEDGFLGAVGLLSDGLSGNDILKEWKREALGYRK